MQQFKVDELKPHPRNEEFFDDMSGDNWEAFLKSIKDRGVIEPVVISPDKTIVSGHQRVRACKELGIENVLCSVHTYDNEDQVLQDLIETNIRQRGIGNPNPIKLGRCIKELERIYGIERGTNQYTSLPKVSVSTQEQLADLIGISVDTLQNYKKLTELVPELQDWVDTGILAPTTALSIVKYMSDEEQDEFAGAMDATKRITKREVENYMSELRNLRQEKEKLDRDIADAKHELEKRPVVEVEPDDYEDLQNEVKNYEKEYKILEGSFQNKVKELQELRKQIDEQKSLEPEEEYKNTIKNSTLTFCAKISKFIEDVGGYVWLSDQINEIPELERAGYIKAVNAIKAWADTMSYNLNGGYDNE